MSATGGEPALRRAVLRLASRTVATRHGVFALHLFRDLVAGRIAMVLARGDVTAGGPLLARVHSSCVTSECLMGCDCDCAEQLECALAEIARAGRGLVVYLMQEGRGAGLSAKARDRMLVQASGHRITTFDAYAAMGLPADLRRYDVVAPILAMLGVTGPLRLMTNNPEKRAAVAGALAGEKLEVEAMVALVGRGSPFNRDYLSAKRHSGHTLAAGEAAPAIRPPERVEAFDPVALVADPSRCVTASYFLPIALADDVVWFRASVLVDEVSGRESIVLSSGGWAGPEVMVLPGPSEWLELSLLDRLPLRVPRGRALLARALRRIAERGGRIGLAWSETTTAMTPSVPPLPRPPTRGGERRGPTVPGGNARLRDVSG